VAWQKGHAAAALDRKRELRDGKIHIEMTCRQIKDSPEYDDTATIDREYEERLHRHYDQAGTSAATVMLVSKFSRAE
jgi:stress response protein YsnF